MSVMASEISEMNIKSPHYLPICTVYRPYKGQLTRNVFSCHDVIMDRDKKYSISDEYSPVFAMFVSCFISNYEFWLL